MTDDIHEAPSDFGEQLAAKGGLPKELENRIARSTLGLAYQYGSHKGPDAPAFCSSCGRSMRVVERRVGFDARTGAAILTKEARCSRPWWAFGFHGHFIGPDAHGDWPVV